MSARARSSRLGLVARILVVGVLGYWALLFALQRQMLFPRPPAGSAPEQPADVRPLWLTTRAGPVEAWLLPPATADTGAAPLIVFFHGNGELIDHWPRAFDALRRRGMAVLLVEYPGYGRSAGAPSEASITEAACAAYDRAIHEPGIDPRRIVAYGRSLGGGAACCLARQRPVAALVLESAFTSVRDLTSRYAAPGFLVRDPFDNLAVVRGHRGPLLILHGSRDQVVPLAHGQRLAAANPRAEFHIRACGHDDCGRPWDLVLAFLEARDLLARESAGRG